MAIQITYRRTSRLSMRIVKNGDVHVSAPIGLPRADVERFIDEHRDWIATARQQHFERQRQRTAFFNQLPLQTREQVDDAIARMDALVLPMLKHHAPRMGLLPPKVLYQATISRWGQCRIKEHTVCFSVYLLLLPEWCAEHVVVHELAHLLEPSHNARFHAIMNRYFPRWREARAVTRRLQSMPDDDDNSDD